MERSKRKTGQKDSSMPASTGSCSHTSRPRRTRLGRFDRCVIVPKAGVAARYWGLTDEDYERRADLWPVNPAGELVSFMLIENQTGIDNVREIVSTEGVSMVSPGPGDLRRVYDGDMVAVERAIQAVLAACKEFDVPCGVTAGPDDVEKRLDEGFRVIIATAPEAIAIGRRASGRVATTGRHAKR